jgi:di- and tripeptidase
MDNPTVISHCATATVSMRIVPNQAISDICAQFKCYVSDTFSQLKSDNRIKVDIQSSADYWLGNPNSNYFKAAELAIEQEWKVKPLYIREGGSIPAVRCLEKFCNAPAIHIPFGQSSDQAHLPNERIRLRNLYAGRRIIKSLLKNIQ